jgi:hypothetical protein
MNEKLPDVSAIEKELDNVLSKFRRGIISDLTFEEAADRLVPEIAKGHSYQFVGRVGLFCPVIDGAGGGILLRNQNDRYYAITGTKKRDGTPYRWLEAELVEKLDMADKIDRSYYDSLVDDAIEAISKYGDFLTFISDDPLAAYMNVPEGAEEIPFA